MEEKSFQKKDEPFSIHHLPVSDKWYIKDRDGNELNQNNEWGYLDTSGVFGTKYFNFIELAIFIWENYQVNMFTEEEKNIPIDEIQGIT